MLWVNMTLRMLARTNADLPTLGLVEIERLAHVRALGASGGAREIRQAARIGLREAAVHLGVNPGTLSMWERGLTCPSPRDAERWGELLERLAAVAGGD